MFAALEAGTPLADLDTAGITAPDGSAAEIIDIGDAPVEGSPPLTRVTDREMGRPPGA